MRLGEIRIHPFKSAAGIALDRVEVEALGPRNDRRWMAVTAEGEFLTQRNTPSLALVRTSLDGDVLTLEKAGLPPLRVPPGSAPRGVQVWGDVVAALDCGDDAAAWLSAAAGTPCRLVHFPDDSRREVDPSFGQPGDRVSFVDAFPFLLLTRASLDDLNARLPEPLPMDRFRPNLVIDGAEPYAEDRWRRIRIGDITLEVVKPCARCVITTTNQETAARGKEPLRTLARYRRRDGHALFAMNAIHRDIGALHVGDAVEVLEIGPALEFD